MWTAVPKRAYMGQLQDSTIPQDIPGRPAGQQVFTTEILSPHLIQAILGWQEMIKKKK
jgi:hypothetical protein